MEHIQDTYIYIHIHVIYKEYIRNIHKFMIYIYIYIYIYYIHRGGGAPIWSHIGPRRDIQLGEPFKFFCFLLQKSDAM